MCFNAHNNECRKVYCQQFRKDASTYVIYNMRMQMLLVAILLKHVVFIVQSVQWMHEKGKSLDVRLMQRQTKKYDQYISSNSRRNFFHTSGFSDASIKFLDSTQTDASIWLFSMYFVQRKVLRDVQWLTCIDIWMLRNVPKLNILVYFSMPRAG